MTTVKSKPKNLNDRLGNWCMIYLPAWLYRLITFQYRQPCTKKDLRASEALAVILIILILASLRWF